MYKNAASCVWMASSHLLSPQKTQEPSGWGLPFKDVGRNHCDRRHVDYKYIQLGDYLRVFCLTKATICSSNVSLKNNMEKLAPATEKEPRLEAVVKAVQWPLWEGILPSAPNPPSLEMSSSNTKLVL